MSGHQSESPKTPKTREVKKAVEPKIAQTSSTAFSELLLDCQKFSTSTRASLMNAVIESDDFENDETRIQQVSSKKPLRKKASANSSPSSPRKKEERRTRTMTIDDTLINKESHHINRVNSEKPTEEIQEPTRRVSRRRSEKNSKDWKYLYESMQQDRDFYKLKYEMLLGVPQSEQIEPNDLIYMELKEKLETVQRRYNSLLVEKEHDKLEFEKNIQQNDEIIKTLKFRIDFLLEDTAKQIQAINKQKIQLEQEQKARQNCTACGNQFSPNLKSNSRSKIKSSPVIIQKRQEIKEANTNRNERSNTVETPVSQTKVDELQKPPPSSLKETSTKDSQPTKLMSPPSPRDVSAPIAIIDRLLFDLAQEGSSSDSVMVANKDSLSRRESNLPNKSERFTKRNENNDSISDSVAIRPPESEGSNPSCTTNTTSTNTADPSNSLSQSVIHSPRSYSTPTSVSSPPVNITSTSTSAPSTPSSSKLSPRTSQVSFNSFDNGVKSPDQAKKSKEFVQSSAASSPSNSPSRPKDSVEKKASLSRIFRKSKNVNVGVNGQQRLSVPEEKQEVNKFLRHSDPVSPTKVNKVSFPDDQNFNEKKEKETLGWNNIPKEAIWHLYRYTLNYENGMSHLPSVCNSWQKSVEMYSMMRCFFSLRSEFEISQMYKFFVFQSVFVTNPRELQNSYTIPSEAPTLEEVVRESDVAVIGQKVTLKSLIKKKIAIVPDDKKEKEQISKIQIQFLYPDGLTKVKFSLFSHGTPTTSGFIYPAQLREDVTTKKVLTNSLDILISCHTVGLLKFLFDEYTQNMPI